MASTISTTLRNTRLTSLTAAFDAGAGPAVLKVFGGTRPAFGGAETTILAQTTYAATAFGAPSNGAVSANTIPNATTTGAGLATWFRAEDSDGNTVMDGDVVSSGAEDGLVISLNPLTVGVELAFSHTITEGNA